MDQKSLSEMEGELDKLLEEHLELEEDDGSEYVTSEQEFSSEEVEENVSDETDNNVLHMELGKPEETRIGLYPRAILFSLLGMLAIYCFFYFLPLEFGDEAVNWLKFHRKCCSFVHNDTRCLIVNNCYTLLCKWLKSANQSCGYSWHFSSCCYWYAPYEKYRMQSLPYCDPVCLKA